jgi:hypothetical protein
VKSVSVDIIYIILRIRDIEGRSSWDWANYLLSSLSRKTYVKYVTGAQHSDSHYVRWYVEGCVIRKSRTRQVSDRRDHGGDALSRRCRGEIRSSVDFCPNGILYADGIRWAYSISRGNV